MYTLDDFHLVHAVELFNDTERLQKILKDEALKSLQYQEENDDDDSEEIDDYSKKVFMGLIMPDKKGIPVFSKPKYSFCAFFIFDPKLITNYSDCSLQLTKGNLNSYPHYCDSWNVGRHTGCLKYDNTKTLLENLAKWRDLHFAKGSKNKLQYSVYGTPMNEITIQFAKNSKEECVEGVVSINQYLQSIYVPKPKNKNFLKVYEKVKILAEKYPQYNWIFEE